MPDRRDFERMRELMRELFGDDNSPPYRDEPIPRRGDYGVRVPSRIRSMRSFAQMNLTQTALFCRQGKFMENYEDDFKFDGYFYAYYPTYDKMNTSELRGYFSWRTKLRRGNIEKTCTSFALVYIYELLNRIGVSSPLDGFEKLKSFYLSYRLMDYQIQCDLRVWLFDYAAYYNIAPELLDDLLTDFDKAIDVLVSPALFSEDEVFDAINVVSSHDISHSRFYKAYPKETKTVLVNVYIALCGYYAKHRGESFQSRAFGFAVHEYYHMFSNAVFKRRTHENCVYSLNNARQYVCMDDKWSVTNYTASSKSSYLGDIVRAVDYTLRKKLGFKYQLKEKKTYKYILAIIESEIDKMTEEKKKTARREVAIDLSKLSSIREAAETTRDKLIVDEEELMDEPTEEIAPQPEETQGSDDENSPLDKNEREFLSRLLAGEQYADFLSQNNIMLSIVVDSINEKLYDTFSDTVILFDGDEPKIIEDYTDDVKGLLT
ncbi:MAG: TerB N-terminal domain-containing protein [Clostridia bacterium]|nr:TerB N-terminal domain-containing protein [Clostridia bacterium]